MQVTHSETLPSLYDRVGGEVGIQQLVDRFYDIMDSLPEVEKTRKLHAKSLRGSRRKLFMFLSGWMGGPPLYAEKYGHPRLRRRHLPFTIGTEERDQWMLCMELALIAFGGRAWHSRGDVAADLAMTVNPHRGMQALP